MTRVCAQCDISWHRSDYSRNQWRKGEGNSHCENCVEGLFTCLVCLQTFQTKNGLNMHMQVHRPRNVACPFCGDVQFKTMANAVQHVESGYCHGCRPSADTARERIYKSACAQRSLQRFLTPNDFSTDTGVPDFPYKCRRCNQSFRQLSQLLQHQDNKHGNTTLGLGF